MRHVQLIGDPARGNLTHQLAGLMFFVFQDVDGRLGLRVHQSQRGPHIGDDRRQRGLILQRLTGQSRLVDKHPQHIGFVMFLIDLVQQTFEGDQLLKRRQQAAAR
jgi:hypothetical protein